MHACVQCLRIANPFLFWGWSVEWGDRNCIQHSEWYVALCLYEGEGQHCCPLVVLVEKGMVDYIRRDWGPTTNGASFRCESVGFLAFRAVYLGAGCDVVEGRANVTPSECHCRRCMVGVAQVGGAAQQRVNSGGSPLLRPSYQHCLDSERTISIHLFLPSSGGLNEQYILLVTLRRSHLYATLLVAGCVPRSLL